MRNIPRLPEVFQDQANPRFAFLQTLPDLLKATVDREIRRGVSMQLKPDGTKVTTADTAANLDFINLVTEAFPNDIVLGEEAKHNEHLNRLTSYTWVIDPIDGTSGFWRSVEGGRMYDCTASIMVALFEPGAITPSMSFVYTAFGDQPWIMLSNGTQSFTGTVRQNELTPITITSYAASLEEPRTYEDNYWLGAQPNLKKIMPTEFKSAHKVRTSSIGTTVSRLVLGQIDVVAFPLPSNPHDLAPCALIAHTAGAIVTDLKGVPFDEIDWLKPGLDGLLVASSKSIHSRTLGAISIGLSEVNQ